MAEPATDPNFERLLAYLRDNRGVDFSGYKRNTLMRRVRRRMEIIARPTFEDYLDYLSANPREFTDLFNFILINVTDFFRDAEAWEYIAETIIPRLLAPKRREEQVRIWSAGCASGQEAYSIAILLAEALGEDVFRERVKIYATDIDEEALNEARQGSYTSRELEQLPPALVEKYFRPLNQRFVFRKDLRRALIFGRHDLVQDAPISRLDLLLCRNLLMYFNSDTQGRVLSRLHFALNDTGYLMLGRAEMLLTHANLFTPVNLRRRVFNRVPRPRLRERLSSFDSKEQEDGMNFLNMDTRLRLRAFDANPVAQIVVDHNHHLLMVNERAQTLFGLARRDVGRPLQDFEIFYRPVELRPALLQSMAEKRNIAFKDVSWTSAAGEARWYDVQLIPLMDNGDEFMGTLVMYTDVTLITRLQEQLEHTNQELETAYEELQSTNEELETTNEELQSTVEELETTNEELHSTNEELETINEELQSTNEELETLNHELRRRSDELNQVNSFMETIFANLPMAVVVLDREQLVQVWSQRADDLWGLRSEEAVGQHFMNLDIGLPVERLKLAIRSALSADATSQIEILPATNRRGKAITCKVTCMPLRSNRESVSGVIVVMEERDGHGEGLLSA